MYSRARLFARVLTADRSPPGEHRLADDPGGGDAGAAAGIPGVGDLDEVAADDLAAAQEPDDLDQLGDADAAGLRRAGAGRLGGIEHVDVDGDVERVAGQLRQQAAHGLDGMHLEHREEPGAGSRVLFPGARPHPDLVHAFRRDDVHHPGHGGGVVVALAEERLAEVGVGVELQHAKPGELRGEGLDDGHGGGVVAAEHEGEQARPPPGGDLRASRVELLARRRAVGQLAIAEVGERQVLQVPPRYR